MNAINPATFIGGTWNQIKNKLLYCADSSLELVGDETSFQTGAYYEPPYMTVYVWHRVA